MKRNCNYAVGVRLRLTVLAYGPHNKLKQMEPEDYICTTANKYNTVQYTTRIHNTQQYTIHNTQQYTIHNTQQYTIHNTQQYTIHNTQQYTIHNTQQYTNNTQYNAVHKQYYTAAKNKQTNKELAGTSAPHDSHCIPPLHSHRKPCIFCFLTYYEVHTPVQSVCMLDMYKDMNKSRTTTP